MTISTQDSKVNYQGNGQTTVFQIPFPFLENNQIYVQKKDAEGNLINYTYATDYTVTGAGEENGGSVTLNVAPEQGSSISIYRDVPLTQEVDYRENEIFPAETHEEALDKLTMEVQQIQEQLDRSFKVDRFSDVDLDSVINEIERVYDSTDNIDIVANNINNVNAVGDNIANVNTVAGDIDSVVTTATNVEDVKTVAQNKASLNITAANITDVKTVSSIKDNVDTVAGNNTNITTVATNISDVNTAASNMAAIQDAPNQANLAKNSATQASQSAKSATQSAQTATNKADEASESARQALSALSLQIGDVCFVPLGIDESLNLRRYLNGQVIIQSQFVAFTNKVKSAIALYPNLATTETNWQAEKTNSKLGQCGKFVVDDTVGTIRLPCVVNAQGLVDLALVGGIKNESLPNIKGETPINAGYDASNITGAFLSSKSNKFGYSFASSDNNTNTRFDASNYSPTYQDNAPVQQEAVQYPYCIQVATGVEESVDVTREIELNNPFSLLDYKWSEYEITNASWLLSNGQFNSGATYVAVYELLLKIKNGTETKDGVSVKLSTEAYTDTDFVINTADTTFKLPVKVKLASGNRVAGNGMTLGMTEGTNYAGFRINDQRNVRLSVTGYGTAVGTTDIGGTTLNYNKSLGITTDPTKSGIETSSDGLKLYFYVGDTVQDASLINAGAVLGQLANVNAASRGYVVDSYHNGTEWYRIYSDGWIEQGGVVPSPATDSSKSVSLLKEFTDTNYSLLVTENGTTINDQASGSLTCLKRVSSFQLYNNGYGYSGHTVNWFACGY